MHTRINPDQVRIEPWTEDDLDILRRANAPEMMTYLGGPETDEQVVARHERYVSLNDRDTGQMFRIVFLPDGIAVGGIGLWDSEWQDAAIYETGWSVLPEFQGRGIATAAIGLVIARARSGGRHRHLSAFPAVGNAASNAVCRKAGFTLIAGHDDQYPPGSGKWMRINEWRLDLTAST